MRYVIWSNEQRAWWAAYRHGYERCLEEAGRYSREEAIQICKAANTCFVGGVNPVLPDEIPVLFEDALETMNKRFFVE